MRGKYTQKRTSGATAKCDNNFRADIYTQKRTSGATAKCCANDYIMISHAFVLAAHARGGVQCEVLYWEKNSNTARTVE